MDVEQRRTVFAFDVEVVASGTITAGAILSGIKPSLHGGCDAQPSAAETKEAHARIMVEKTVGW